MRENRLSGLMRGGKQTVNGPRASQSVASRLLYTPLSATPARPPSKAQKGMAIGNRSPKYLAVLQRQRFTPQLRFKHANINILSYQPMVSPPKKASVFISYSKKDVEFVTRLVETLKGKNVPVWIDQEQIRPGESIPRAVSRGIEQAEYVLVVLSSTSVKANWLQAELDAAWMKKLSGKGAEIVPIVTGDLANDEIPAFLQPIAFADFRDSFDSGLQRLLSVFAQETELLPAENRKTLISNPNKCVRELSGLSSGSLRRRITRQMNQDRFREMWLEITNAKVDEELETQPLWSRVTALIEWAKQHNQLPAVFEWVCDHEHRRRRQLILAFFIVCILLMVCFVPLPYSLSDTTRVPATNGLGFDIPSLDDFQDANARASRGLIKLPSHATLSCEFTKDNGLWTDDRLQNIEDELQRDDVDVDITALEHGWTEACHENVDLFEKWLETQHERLVVATKTGTTRSSVNDSVNFRKGLDTFVRGELVDMLNKHRKDPPPIVVAVSAKNTNSFMDVIAAARRAFWKRLIGLNYLESDPNQRLGPYFHADGQPSKFETKGPGAGYPRGCLLAVTYRVTVSDRELTAGDVVPFYNRTHIVENRGDKTQLIRLVMNDDITEDNGPGRCDVSFRIKGHATLIWLLCYRLMN